MEIETEGCDKRETNRVRDRGREGRNRGVLECRKPMERERDGVRVRSHHVNSLKHRIEMEEAVAMAAEAASFC